MTPEQEEILLKAIQTFGFDNQLCKLMEECGELVQAANKYREFRTPKNMDNFISEIADVEILIEQLKLHMFTHGTIHAYKEQKISKLRHKIEKAKQ